jgi:hypothetical protein
MKAFIALFTALFVVGCGTRDVILRASGETASVNLNQGGAITGELIALTDSTLFVTNPTVHEIPLSSISSVNVDLGTSREWVTNVVIFEGIPSVLGIAVGNVWISGDRMSYVGARSTFQTLGIIGMVGTALTVLAFELTEPQTTFLSPFANDQRETMRHYFRYPFGLPAEQLKLLRESSATGK